jgi:dTDP-4-dehydrorhamnose reductase
MTNALIGFSGFIGSTLLRQTSFSALYRSANIAEIDGGSFDTVVCAGAPAQKWLANLHPESDLRNIQDLTSHLKNIRCNTFILISTVDVFKIPKGVDEGTYVDEEGLHAYGRHRRLLEKHVEACFPNYLIIRLPGLVGPGLRKNVIFDLLNNNNLHAIDSRSVFQFYPVVNLWYDIHIALNARLRLVHLAAEPISVTDVALQGFGKPFEQINPGIPPCYDMQTRHAEVFGAHGHYSYSRRDTLQAIRCYAQSEPLTPELVGARAA